MNPLRRAALMRGAQVIAGGAAAMASLGKQQSGQTTALNQAMQGFGSNYATAAGEYYGEKISVDPTWEARENACRPIYQKMEQFERSRRFKISENAYLDGIKSVSPHWKHSVMLDRERRRATAMETLHDQLRKLRESPMEKLEQMANEALSAFMTEMGRP